jgi:hypothetical protein
MTSSPPAGWEAALFSVLLFLVLVVEFCPCSTSMALWHEPQVEFFALGLHGKLPGKDAGG